ncbi:RIP metalloprotease RseP [Aureisphaera galaxeae]|uniref:RIP metalloprotease RseP n=1 Tax=Aureisphaera galaxeae TaxID=1538023 RepID=UPI002350DC1A|nr:RIP metalloprotease RseP [Aureisphaera galaxeae]MDC8002511.1 RIP metalloprotease RseP [Aureisphaera galaxeae]
MEIVIKISQFLLSLSLLIVLHEFGHYLPARAFKTRVEKFFLFFDIKYALFRKKIGETVYGIGWLPLGGYVKISGMIDESMDKEQMAQPPQPWEFRSKKAWQRLIIMLGGVIVNFILALLIYVFASAIYGDLTVATNSIEDGYWVENPVLQELGIETGDKVVSIDGETFTNYQDMRSAMILGEKITIEKQGGVQKTIDLPEDFLGRITDQNDVSLLELRIPFMVGRVDDASPNKDGDFEKGDLIVGIDGQPTKYYDVLVPTLLNYKGQDIMADVVRDGKNIQVPLKVTDEGKMGIYPVGKVERFTDLPEGYFALTRKHYSFGESFGVGTDKFVKQISNYWGQLKKIVNPKTGAYKGVGGFKAIYDIFPSEWSWEDFWKLTAFLSIMLGVLNLLPIPALDGGHVMFLLWEMVTGRKPGDKFMEYAQVVGFFLLIALLLFANGNDIYRAITK